MPLKPVRAVHNGIFKENVIPEPESATQAIYGDLDSVVQAVFTDQGAEPGEPAFGGQRCWPDVDPARIGKTLLA